jgi:hypothetical protein
LNYFVSKWSEDTGIENLPEDEQKKIVKEIEIFINYSLYYMKKYYFLEDEKFFRHISCLNPTKFSKKARYFQKN